MKERPILFNGQMVKAILVGRKTQTRRVLKVQPDEDGLLLFLPSSRWLDTSEREYNCPFGDVGDQLWVRETFSLLGNEDGCPVDWNDNIVTDKKDAARIYKASCWQKPNNYGIWSVPDREMEFDGAWTPSIHMPRWASRIDLLITGVRVERLQDISQEDAQADGFELSGWVPTYSNPDNAGFDETLTPYDNFAETWESIYGQRSWLLNPWVWVINFENLRAGGQE